MNLREQAEADNSFLLEDAVSGFGVPITLRPPAIAAVLDLEASGIAGTAIPAGTKWKAGARLYTQGAGATVGAGGTVTFRVTADAPGAAGNLDDGAALTLNTPISGISGAVVSATITAGADPEITVNGRANRIGIDINPETGAIIPGTKSSVTVRLSSVGALPVEGWGVEFRDITGELVTGRAQYVMPDRTAGRATILIRR